MGHCVTPLSVVKYTSARAGRQTEESGELFRASWKNRACLFHTITVIILTNRGDSGGHAVETLSSACNYGLIFISGSSSHMWFTSEAISQSTND